MNGKPAVGAPPRRSAVLRFILTPHGMLVTTVLISLFGWLAPGDQLTKGFPRSAEFGVEAVVGLLTWYGLLLAGARIGLAAAGMVPLPRRLQENLQRLMALDAYPYLLLIFAAAGLGTWLAWREIAGVFDLTMILYLLSESQANRLLYALYENYEAGLLSLRYLAVPAAAIIYYRLIFVRPLRRPIFDFILGSVALIMMALNVILANRLMFVQTILTVALLAYNNGKLSRIRIVPMLVTVGFFFTVIGIASFLRTAATYGGEANFLNILYGQIVSYTGSSFQAAINTCNYFFDIMIQEDIHLYTEVFRNLTTLSAFNQSVMKYGEWSFLYGFCMSFGVAFMFRIFSRLPGTVLSCAAAATLYVFAELWRLDALVSGVVRMMILTCGFVPLMIAGTVALILPRRAGPP